MSKKAFLFGLALGGVAIARVSMKMDDDKKAELKAKAQQGLADFKDRAIDYAFYANDAAEDFKEEAGKQFEFAKDKVADFADQYQAAKDEGGASFGSSLDEATDSLRSELAKVEADDDNVNDDIVIDSAEAFGTDTSADSETDADVDSAAEADNDETSAASDATSTADSAEDDQPEA
ncbi:YtxH domain-containing protein [Lactiplantibacillus daowaiensis]|uniref:YtxH domain-containing protein n=1 Tax=Lactiplantibacillus daowaiensis TaxID=2559918 RepID=A0ABW1S096_9LACO|nr:YtxH domain-containing protein [Lactiplantibacillus daowaiensis]